MLLAAGARVGPYEILSMLGRGGMGEVYRARDTRLNRDVAVKVLQSTFVDDADRVARFNREAQLLGALNHPNIAQLHGLEDADGHRALVMELVEGVTLAERLFRGALPLEEALPIARQIVEALETAHAAGIVHRDLKPSNIKVRDDGTVKVLDFGLAKALVPDGAASGGATNSPTLSMHATAAGIILGTAAYMSPEQARGRPVDKRADIWAFGAILYEVLTGRRAFEADDTSDTLAFVLTKDPDWTALAASTPAVIRRLVRRCLEKDPKRRLPDIGVARLDIDEALTSPAVDSAASSASRAEAGRAGRQWLLRLAVGVLTAAVAAGATWAALRQTPVSSPVTRFRITLPPDQPLAVSFNDRDLAVSPDGTHLVYTAGVESQLMVRGLDRLDASALSAITNARAPFVSPDGRWVGYFDRLDEGVTTGPVVIGTLRKVPIAGGPPVVIAPITGASRGASWGPDDSIVFATSDPTTGLLRVSARGGEPEVLTRPNAKGGELDHHYPSVLPGGRGVLFTIVIGRPRETRVAVLDLRTGQWKTLIRSGSQAEYIETGHLVYQDGGALWAIKFDETTLEVVGDPVPVLEQVAREQTAMNFAVSRHGTLVYAPGVTGNTRSFVWVDRQGREQPIAAPPRPYGQARLSPDGSRFAVAINEGRGYGLWVWDLTLQRLTRLPFDVSSTFVAWSPDSRYLVFNSADKGLRRLVRRAADGTGPGQVLTTVDDDRWPRASAISPDGKHLLFEMQTPASSYDVMTVSLEDPLIGTERGARPSGLLDTPSDERNASFAPNGRWIAYESNKSGQSQVYVKPFPNVGDAEYQMSTEGGRAPLWSPDGHELFFVRGSALIAVAVELTPTFKGRNSTTLFEGASRIFDGRLLGSTARTYDISRDGQRFLMTKEAGGDQSSGLSMVVVQNWFQELQAGVPKTR